MSIDPMEEARGWVADCMWADITDPEQIEEMPDDAIRDGVENHYEGGWTQFLADLR